MATTKEPKNTEKVFSVVVEGKTILFPITELEKAKKMGCHLGAANALYYAKDVEATVGVGKVMLVATWNHNYQGTLLTQAAGSITKEFPSTEKALEMLETLGEFPGEFIMKLAETGTNSVYSNGRNTYLTGRLSRTLNLL